jgi:very-short-patch-repair endonuclease
MVASSQTLVARRLRRDAIEAEKKLWRALFEADLPWKVRRQHPIGPYFVDFACPKRRLVIELDGGQHALAAATDSARTAAIARCGYRVIRFWNNDVMANLTGVMEEIRRQLEAA